MNWIFDRFNLLQSWFLARKFKYTKQSNVHPYQISWFGLQSQTVMSVGCFIWNHKLFGDTNSTKSRLACATIFFLCQYFNRTRNSLYSLVAPLALYWMIDTLWASCCSHDHNERKLKMMNNDCAMLLYSHENWIVPQF